MQKLNNRIILPALTGILGGVWVFVGLTKYGWYADGKPASGFFPTIIGALMLVVSVIAVMGESGLEVPQFRRFHLYPVVTAVSVVMAAMLIGFFPAMVLYVFGWLRLYEKYSLKASVITSAAAIGAMYGIFAVWLRVPFPVGIIFEGLLR